MNWEDDLIKKMIDNGWKCDTNNELKLGFVFYEDEQHEWIRDYDKTSRRFIQFNGKQLINLRLIENCSDNEPTSSP